MNICCKIIRVIKRLFVNLPCNMRYWGFINRLLYVIWITETLFMANHITSLLKTKLKIFNILTRLNWFSRKVWVNLVLTLHWSISVYYDIKRSELWKITSILFDFVIQTWNLAEFELFAKISRGFVFADRWKFHEIRGK